MTDIVEELRKIEDAGDIPPKGHPSLAGRAANEIERLRAKLGQISREAECVYARQLARKALLPADDVGGSGTP